MSDGPCPNERAAHALVHTLLSSDPADLARHLAYINLTSGERETFEAMFMAFCDAHLSSEDIIKLADNLSYEELADLYFGPPKRLIAAPE